jgi:hypothetical protein
MPIENLLGAQDEMKARMLAQKVKQSEKRKKEKRIAKTEYMRTKREAKSPTRPARVTSPMPPDDPLYEMLPSQDKLQSMLWHPKSFGNDFSKNNPAVKEDIEVQEPFEKSLSTRSFSGIVKKFLHGRIGGRGRTRLEQILDNLTEIAKSKSPQAVAAARELKEWSYGKSGEEVDDKKRKGVMVVYVEKLPDNIPVEKPHEQLPPMPEFIDAEFGERQ